MSDSKQAGDISMPSYDSLRLEAESLRERIGQENVNQSSVIASRRLDEALLRLDRAVGKSRDGGRTRQRILNDGRSHDSGSSVAPAEARGTLRAERELSGEAARRSASSSKSSDRSRDRSRDRSSDLELDDSISQSSSVWLESIDEERSRYRLDEGSEATETSGPHLRSVNSHARPASKRSPGNSPKPGNPPQSENPPKPGNPPKPVASSKPSPVVANGSGSIADDGFSAGGLSALFASPIDVMWSSHDHAIAQDDESAIVTSVPRAKLAKPTHPTSSDELMPSDELMSSNELIPGELKTRKREFAVDSNHVQAGAAESAEVGIAQEELADSLEPKSDRRVVQEAVEDECDSPSVRAASRLTPFQATWQVDEFIVPSIVDELFLAGSIAEQLAARLAAARADGLHTIAVTSAKSGEGRSTVSIGMALSVAFSGLKVALVDADPQGVNLATDLQLDLDNSWLDTVRTDLPLAEAAVYSNADSLTLLPMLARDDEHEMESTDLRRLLRKLKSCFDLVIVDCGASAVTEVALCDTALIVRDVNRTKALEVETLAMSLRRNGLQGIGVVENFCQG